MESNNKTILTLDLMTKQLKIVNDVRRKIISYDIEMRLDLINEFGALSRNKRLEMHLDESKEDIN